MDWSEYWRSPDRPLEAMHAHFERHVYHRHSHEAYSFGVTEDGYQAFRCRGGAHTSASGMVMAFNPDDPHDGRAADELGFTYRIVHIGPELVAGVLADVADGAAVPPLFASPVVADPVLARNLRGLHAALLGGAPALRRDELLTAALGSLVARASTGRLRVGGAHAGRSSAERARELLDARYLEDVGADALADAAGCSRFALYRAFRAAYGMAPGDYQRQLRLRAARRLIGSGAALADAAARAGFADQSHLTRWFVRCYGMTPGAYRDARTG
ncbi:AraC family transcriptional regulator [Actinomadura fibrosa]|uniref:AraC family ligand binding domain-containing protein n=1 Tax=Actinomadura fibrosa TaxID=111802 RepID=A0ABW2XE36_9ACTN|nr:AraC family transcriptional regulator [Actinomadura fibrosa]